jgi:carbonic anhydrase/acetyltransferase-like protein (isoleucine patch superfamily)
MLIEHQGRRPRVAPSAYIAPNAIVAGDVTVGDDCRVLFGAVVTAEHGGIVELGERAIVMEQAVVRGRSGHPARVGRHVLIGPHAHVNGATLDDGVFIATGASVFPGARLAAGAEVRINGVVHVNSSLPEAAVVPIGWVAVGDPARVLPPAQHDQIAEVQRRLDFVGTVYGVDRGPVLEEMAEITGRYAELFGRHRDDRTVG